MSQTRQKNIARIRSSPSSGTLWLNPVVLFVAAWTMICLLYSLHLSRLLIFSDQQILYAVSWIILPFVLTGFLVSLVCALAPKVDKPVKAVAEISTHLLGSRLRRCFIFWLAATIVEIGVSGGVPLLWLIRGSAKTYFDFGIPSIHGLLNSLLLSIGLGEVALFAIDGKKHRLRIPAWILIWSFIVVTRNMMVVFLIEGVVVWILLKGVRWGSIVRILFSAAAMILVFGYIGDFRSGAAEFRSLALPTKAYPDWLPSGVLWVYIYVTTPVGNLVNTAHLFNPLHSLLFPNTTSLLFPTVLRDIVYGGAAQASEAFSGNLVSQAFNVSTAYMGPFQDFGWLGVALFSVALSMVAMYCWRLKGLKGMLIYAVIAQCVILSVFFNHLFYLPVITQVFWIVLFFHKSRIQRTHEANHTAM